jgi:TonB family protein
VRLKITLLANGQVGSIVPLTRLPNGLTERAIAAARLIRFEPKTINGTPVSVTVTREYTFTIY